MWIHYPGWIGIWSSWLLWREENQSIWRKTLNQGKNQMTNSTHIGQNRTWATLVGGEQSHCCPIHAPSSINNFLQWKTQTCSPVASLLFPGKFLPQPVDFGSWRGLTGSWSTPWLISNSQFLANKWCEFKGLSSYVLYYTHSQECGVV